MQPLYSTSAQSRMRANSNFSIKHAATHAESERLGVALAASHISPRTIYNIPKIAQTVKAPIGYWQKASTADDVSNPRQHQGVNSGSVDTWLCPYTKGNDNINVLARRTPHRDAVVGNCNPSTQTHHQSSRLKRECQHLPRKLIETSSV